MFLSCGHRFIYLKSMNTYGIIDELLDSDKQQEQQHEDQNNSSDDVETQSLGSSSYQVSSPSPASSPVIGLNKSECYSLPISESNAQNNPVSIIKKPESSSKEADKEFSYEEVKAMSREDISNLCENLITQEAINKMKDEDIDGEAFISLLELPSDSGVFQRLGITFGKTIQLKLKFKDLMAKQFPTRKEKPRREQIEAFTPRTKSLYQTKRKQIGVEASKFWKGAQPIFTSPERKVELREFAEMVARDCSFQKIGFGVEGIMEHTKAYFTEQRRYAVKKKLTAGNVDNEVSNQSTPLITPLITPTNRVPMPVAVVSSLKNTKKRPLEASTTNLTASQSVEANTGNVSTLNTESRINFKISETLKKKKKTKDQVSPIVIKKLSQPNFTSTQKDVSEVEDPDERLIRRNYNISHRKYTTLSKEKKMTLINKIRQKKL